MSASEFQATMAGYLLSLPGQPPSEQLSRAVKPGKPSAAARFAVYKNNVLARLVESLQATYPVVERLVGLDFFRFAALTYIGEHPPRTASLLEFGEAFAGFLEDFGPAHTLPYLPDVARLEYLYLQAYHAAEAAILGERGFAVLDPLANPDARLILHPSVQLLRSTYPVSRIWEINRLPTEISETLSFPQETEYLLIIRPEATVEVRRIGNGAYALLKSLVSGGSVRDAIQFAYRLTPGSDPGSALASLQASRVFVNTENDNA